MKDLAQRLRTYRRWRFTSGGMPRTAMFSALAHSSGDESTKMVRSADGERRPDHLRHVHRAPQTGMDWYAVRSGRLGRLYRGGRGLVGERKQRDAPSGCVRGGPICTVRAHRPVRGGHGRRALRLRNRLLVQAPNPEYVPLGLSLGSSAGWRLTPWRGRSPARRTGHKSSRCSTSPGVRTTSH